MGKKVFTIVCAWFAMLAMSAQEQPEDLYTLQGDGKLVVNEKYRATNEVYDLKEKLVHISANWWMPLSLRWGNTAMNSGAMCSKDGRMRRVIATSSNFTIKARC